MTDLSALFSRDPLTLTSEDLTELITAMRGKRGQFKLDGTPAKVTTSKPKAPAKPSALAAAGIELKLDL